MAKFDRANGRKSNQIRSLACEIGLLNRADGSVRFSQDKSSLIVGLYGPVESKGHEDTIDRACVSVSLTPASGQKSASDTQCEFLIRQTIETIILASLLPRCSINIEVQVLQEDGGLLATAINATCLALLDAGIPCSDVVASVCIGIRDDGKMFIDPDATEEKAFPASVTLAFASNSANVVLFQSRGVLEEETLPACLELGRKACSKIHKFYRLSLEKRLEKPM